MATVNTNAGALVALQNLTATNKELETTQSRINTGLKVSSAKDNGAVFAIAQRMRETVAGIGAVKQGVDRGISVVDVAISAGESISDLLLEMKEKAVAAADPALSTSDRAAFNEDFESLRDQITTVINSAEFNGINLINSTGSGLKVMTEPAQNSVITVSQQNLTLGGGVVTVAATASISTQALASGMIGTLSTSIGQLSSALSRLGTASKKLEVHNTFLTKLSDSLEVGIGNLVDADLAKESAKLQSLQVKQQLGVSALSIANQAPSVLLGLF